VYIGLLAWRLYDWGNLLEDEADSFWLFIKWVAFDGVFWYGLPAMRIPWLEWSNPVITGIFLAHAILNGMLMFRIPVSDTPIILCLVSRLKVSDSNRGRLGSCR
jgi:nucleoporin POM152